MLNLELLTDVPLRRPRASDSLETPPRAHLSHRSGLNYDRDIQSLKLIPLLELSQCHGCRDTKLC
jgi:hypothetical protein